MNQNSFARDELEKVIINRWPIIDVRAPIEFGQGSLPGSVNLPILTDVERDQIGKLYKSQGQQAAVALGEQLVSGAVRENRVRSWLEFIQSNPNSIFTCFRGGLRSKTAQRWAHEAGVQKPRIEGGYKEFRQFLIEKIDSIVQQTSLLVVSGATGSGKTLLLRDLHGERPVLDLEDLGAHRGSAFGGMDRPQPSQATFENSIAAQLIRLQKQLVSGPLVVEDESRLVGRVAQPEVLFQKLRNSSIVLVDESLNTRTENTFEEYILRSALAKGDVTEALKVAENYRQSLAKIQKLGGSRFAEVKKDMEFAIEQNLNQGVLESHKVWIEKLLLYYYDPLYLGSLERRNPNIIFRGNRSEVTQFLKSKSDH